MHQIFCLTQRAKQTKVSVKSTKDNSLASQFPFSLHNSSPTTQIVIIRRLMYASYEVHLIRCRSMRISGMCFNLNTYRDEKIFLDFRFRHNETPVIMGLFEWTSGKTMRNKTSGTRSFLHLPFIEDWRLLIGWKIWETSLACVSRR